MINADSSQAIYKAQLVAKRIISSIIKPIEFKEYRFCVDASIGLKLIAPERQSIESVLKDADLAMYKAKKLSEQKICVCE